MTDSKQNAVSAFYGLSIDERKASSRRVEQKQRIREADLRTGEPKLRFSAWEDAVEMQRASSLADCVSVYARFYNGLTCTFEAVPAEEPASQFFGNAVSEREWIMLGEFYFQTVSMRSVRSFASLGFRSGDCVNARALSPIDLPAIDLNVLASDGKRSGLPTPTNARVDRKWLFADEQPAQVLPAVLGLRPRFEYAWLAQEKGVVTRGFVAESMGSEQFALWQCVAADAKSDSSKSGKDQPMDVWPVAAEVTLIEKARGHVTTLAPSENLVPGALYCFSINDWQLHERHAAQVARSPLSRLLAASEAGARLPAGLQAIVLGYAAPDPPPLVRLGLPDGRVIETLGGTASASLFGVACCAPSTSAALCCALAPARFCCIATASVRSSLSLCGARALRSVQAGACGSRWRSSPRRKGSAISRA